MSVGEVEKEVVERAEWSVCCCVGLCATSCTLVDVLCIDASDVNRTLLTQHNRCKKLGKW